MVQTSQSITQCNGQKTKEKNKQAGERRRLTWETKTVRHNACFYTWAEEHFKVLLYTYPKVGIPVRYRYPIHTYTVPYKCTETEQIIIFCLGMGTFLTERACWRMSIRGTKTRTRSSHILKNRSLYSFKRFINESWRKSFPKPRVSIVLL
jgi:hypothetical protein